MFRIVQEKFNLFLIFKLTLQAGFLLGLIYGIVEVLLDVKWLRRRPFGLVLLTKGVIHVLIVLVITILIRREAFIYQGIELTPEVMKASVFNRSLIGVMVYTLLVSAIITFVRGVDQKFGPGILWKFITGKFRRPREEERIFMFLDLKSSTTIAEQLGHIKFSQLLQDCFNDLSVVVNYKAEIYQYVGDEAVLSWNVKDGLKDFNCLKAFFKFDEQLQQRADHYQSNYGLQPIFKAGLNVGKVTLAEVGEIKREIAFHGDTLNTASRIQDKCNDFGKRLLISEFLETKLQSGSDFSRQLMGQVALKGKQKEVNIYAVELL